MKKILTCLIQTSLLLSCTTIFANSFFEEPIIPIPHPGLENPNQIELGRLLFNDVRLSKGAQLSCASCHSLWMGGADGQVVSTGVDGKKGSLNSPTIFNSSLLFRQFWDGRAANLLEQIDGPIANPREMDSNWEDIIEVLKQDPFYIEQFTRAYPDGLTILNIKKAIVTFEASLLTPDSQFDQFLRGNKQAITNEELKGYILFKDYGCVSCHQGVAVGGDLYQKFGAFGNYFVDRGNVTANDYGLFNITKEEADRFVFKVPTLRNIELTAPYFHDGSQKTLESAVKVMIQYQLGRSVKEQDIRLIVKFLKTLTGSYKGQSLREYRP